MNKIKIIAKELADDKIQLIDIDNIISIEQMKQMKYGEEIVRIYTDGGDFMNRSNSYTLIVCSESFGGRLDIPFDGSVIMERNDFDKLIRVIRNIATRYSDIKRKVYETMEKNIVFEIIID